MPRNYGTNILKLYSSIWRLLYFIKFNKAPKSNAPIDKNNLSKEERSKLIATGKLREKRMEEQKLLDEMSRNYTGKNLPGDGFHQVNIYFKSDYK